MNDLELFTYNTHAMRVVMVDGEPWFVATDVCKLLGYAHVGSALRMLRDGERGLHPMHTPGGQQELAIVSEQGLYRLIMRSNQPAAQPFQDWVTGEVLPAIRQTGKYAPAEQFAIPKSYAEALELAASQARQIEENQRELEASRPKVEFYDQYVDAAGNYKIGDVAKVLAIPGLGQNRLFAMLRTEGVLIAGGKSHNSPYQHHVNLGRFVLKVTNYDRGDGTVGSSMTTYATPKGLDYIRKMAASLGFESPDNGGVAVR